jgi:hypothetical protein
MMSEKQGLGVLLVLATQGVAEIAMAGQPIQPLTAQR